MTLARTINGGGDSGLLTFTIGKTNRASGSSALAAPLAPTLAAFSGYNQAALTITDDPASSGVQKWGVYESTTVGGAYSFAGWAYRKDQLYRRYLANGSTMFYKATAWNAYAGGTESALSAAVSATTSASNSNPLRLVGTLYFVNTLFYAQVAGDFLSGSTITATASDGTTLTTTVTPGSSILISGTFTTAGNKTITFTENFSGGGSATSTQVINVVQRAAFSLASVYNTATAVKARMNAVPVYNTGTLTVTDTGTTMPGGYTQSHTYFDGNSGLSPCVSTVIGNFTTAQFKVYNYDPIEKKAFQDYSQQGVGNNAVMRMRLFKQTFILGMGSDGGTVVGHFKARYSDDNMATWTESVDPTFIRYTSGSHYFKLDGGTVPGAGGRVWEVEFSSYTYFTNTASVFGFGYETGDTPQAVTDTSPAAMIMTDSFANGVGALDQTKNMLRRATRNLGLLNAWNMGIPTHRWTNPATSTYPLSVDRVGPNTTGLGDTTTPADRSIIFLNYTINDNGQTNYTQAQAMWTNAFLRVRYQNPSSLIILTGGFWAPQDKAGTSIYNAFLAAANDANGNGSDIGMYLNDGVALGWAVPSGTTGSSPYWLGSNSQTITGSTTGSVLTVTAGSGIEAGMYLWNSGGTTWLNARVYKQLSGGTAGGAGTYQLDIAPQGGDYAGGTTFALLSENYNSTTYPVHPNPAGHLWCGDRLADGATTAVNNVIAAYTASPLTALGLSSTTFDKGTSSSGTITGATAGSVISASGLPSGLTINSAARTWAWDGTGPAGTGNIVLTETALAPNSPNPTTIGYTIRPLLGALSLSSTTLVTGTPSSGAVTGLTAGSALSCSGLPSGLTIDTTARTWAWSGTGTVGTTAITLTETLAGASNTPRTSTPTITITNVSVRTADSTLADASTTAITADRS